MASERTTEPGLCSVHGCVRPSRTRGWCATHYARVRRNGTPNDIRPAARAPQGTKWCPKCVTFRPVADFTRNASKRDGLDSLCRTHAREVIAAWRERQGPEYFRRANRERAERLGWNQLQRDRRARRRQAHSTPFRRQAIFERDAWRCHLCGTRIKPTLRYPHPLSASIDHLVPLSAGGAHAPENVRAAHLTCNVRRKTGGTVQLLLLG